MLKFLSRTPVLIFMLIAFLAIGYSFQWVQAGIGEGAILDTISNGTEARARIAAMSGAEKQHHLIGTLLNDSLYPLAYGGLFAGLAARFGGSRAQLAAFPALATVVVDFTENTIQALALAGQADMLAAKNILTPLKFGLFISAVLVAAFLILWAVYRRLTRKAD